MDIGADAELDKVDAQAILGNHGGNWGQATRQCSVCQSVRSQGRGRVQDRSWVILPGLPVLSSGTLVTKRKPWTKVTWFLVFVSVSLVLARGPSVCAVFFFFEFSIVSVSLEFFSFVGACKGPIGSHLFLVTV
ncbi:hypothetical protein EV363DRAFT_1396967 [Boletus edulis]|nr:hypothetical protein EV363DRAFT_1396967 [Boletus edulis]